MANNKRNIRAIDKAARKALDATGNTLERVTTYHQPYVHDRIAVTSMLMDAEIACAVLDYQFRRLLWHSPVHDMDRGNYFVDLLKDIVILLMDIIWGFISPLIHMLVSLVIYAVVSVAMLFLLLYLLSRVF